MRSVVLGKIVENVYSVDLKQKEIKDKDGNIKMVYTDKPVLTKKTNEIDHKEICSFEGVPYYNKEAHYYWSASLSFNDSTRFNISEDETVYVEKEVFRADLNELHLYTNKVLEEIDVDKTEAELIHVGYIKDFNKQMIESNEKMHAYCKLHKLAPGDTDCFELFKLVYPDKRCEIMDGIMRVKSTHGLYLTSDGWANLDTAVTCTAYDGSISTTINANIAKCQTEIDACVTCVTALDALENRIETCVDGQVRG